MISSSTPDRTILAVLPSWLGDTVMALPALRALRARGRVVGLGLSPLVELLQDAELLDEAIPWTKGRGFLGPLKDRRLAAQLGASHHFDEAVCFPPSWRAASIARASGAPLRRGLSGERGRRLLLNRTLPLAQPPRSRHLADEFLEMANEQKAVALPEFQPGPLGRAELEKLDLPKKPWAIMAAGAEFGATKRWPIKSFRSLAQKLAEGGIQTLAVGGPSPADREVARQLAADGLALDLSGQTRLPGLAALLAGARLFIGNDSGPMHLAAAVGTPTLGIFLSTSPGWTAPRGDSVITVGPPELHCSPCFSAKCAFDLECHAAIAPDQVWEAASLLLAGAKR